ncbi:MAG: hypothetical protein HOD00_05275 [Gemmatimonadales bacterium]|jgi:hypothetical protein|nr:hypothetical protein [Verrucomicrobiota bacterium]MBT3497758.1 hypothetical protein [Gemmatimonadales bacterium]NCG33189.1 hypothetical protein [Pseudomonadota bacterium]MBT3774806.1 hypothetical protein [Gemmatimonadales bacterium]MBT3960128.1 hypothetical protein [Gemmatimonadales bacterium]
MTGKAGIRGTQSGSIQISKAFIIVEVSHDMASHVLEPLSDGKIKGKRVQTKIDKGR